MYRLSSIILFLFGFTQIFAQSSPHGKEFNIDCAKCHTSESWNIDYKTLKFDHNITDFKLEGTHTQTNCTDCHKTLVFDEAQTDCISCHTDMHNATVGNDCARCHTPESWIVDNIPELHDENGFSLAGSHSNVDCIECHKSDTNLRFDRLGNDCINCHRDDFVATTNPNHVSANFSISCTDCHSQFVKEWTPVTVEHDFFPLTSGHDIQNCLDCHANRNFEDISSNCVSCHQTNYDNATNPNHIAAGFSTDCASCHNTNPGWSPSTFDHNLFPLTLGHDVQDCAQCHTTVNYSDTSADCASCHQINYDNTTNPNHIAAGFSTDCASCHNTNPGWTPSTFDHSLFPLTLGHDVQDCAQCHTTANYSDASPDCVSCHQTTFNNTTNPNHIAAGFSTDCASCHNTNPGWTPSTFDHSLFPLTLGHDLQDCTQCHTTGNYSDASPDCVSCHQTTFNNTTNPDHVAAGFPTDCASCHTTNPGWTPSTFEHDGPYFPIYSGEHRGTWNSCADCHTVANNFASFSCIDCHEHSNKAQLDSEHGGIANYVYESNACLDCHPTGNSD